MSLAIDVDLVDGVLLADGWHVVADASFTLDAYEYIWNQGWTPGQTNWDHNPPDKEPPDPMVFDAGKYTSYLGFSFLDDESRVIQGPVTAILAVRHKANARAKVSRKSSPSQAKRRPISMRTRFTVLERDGFRCVHCGAKPPAAELQLDHVHPVSLGGDDSEANLVMSCADCNNGRGARLLVGAVE